MATCSHYRAFGLRIRSALPLEEIPPNEPEPWDLSIETGTIDRTGPKVPFGRIYEGGPCEQYLCIGSVGKFLIEGTHTITVDLAPDFPPELAGYALLGPVMAALLHARGNLILHGSALEVEGRAVLFIGDKGAGKSTTAGAFVGAGHGLLTDDVVTIDWNAEGIPLVVPSYPTMKLSRAALELIGEDRFTILPPPPGNFHKHRVSPRQEGCRNPAPISAIYALKRGSADAPASLSSLATSEALRLLFLHSYMARHGRDPFAHEGWLAAHLAQCSRLVGATDMAILHAPGSIARLPEAIDLIVKGVRARAAAA